MLETTEAHVLAALPLFVLMGAILERSGIAGKLFDAIHIWTWRLPGGLAVGTVVMCTIFAACSGVIGGDRDRGWFVGGAGHAAPRLRQGADLRHGDRRRLVRSDHPAVGGGDHPGGDRRVTPGRYVHGHADPGIDDGRVLHGLYRGALLDQSILRAERAGGGCGCSLGRPAEADRHRPVPTAQLGGGGSWAASCSVLPPRPRPPPSVRSASPSCRSPMAASPGRCCAKR